MNGDEARAVRRGMGMSARELGELVGVDESSIYRWEKRGAGRVPRMYALALRALLYEQQHSQDEPNGPRVSNGN